MEQRIQPTKPAIEVVGEQQGSYLKAEFMQSREGCWTHISGKLVFIGCGDDREPTADSASELFESTATHGDVMNPMDGYASIYGGVTGQAKNVLVVGAAQYGDEFIDTVGGFEGIMDLLIRGSHHLQTVHSAAGNEHNQRHFLMHGGDPVGCAYAAGIGATSALIVSGEHHIIRDVAKLDQNYIFGSDAGFADLLRGHQAFLNHATNNKGSDFAFDRPNYKKYLERYSDDLGLMILAGNHVPAHTSGVISNFSLDEVGSAHTAHEQGLDFYRLDMAVITDIVLRTLSKPLQAINKNYVLSPELLMRAFQLDSVPVRAVLVSQGQGPSAGKPDPGGLAIGMRGDQFSAIKTLLERQANGTYGK